MAANLAPSVLKRHALEDQVAREFTLLHGLTRTQAIKLADELSAQIPDISFEYTSSNPHIVLIAYNSHASSETSDAYIITLRMNGTVFTHRVTLPLTVQHPPRKSARLAAQHPQ